MSVIAQIRLTVANLPLAAKLAPFSGCFAVGGEAAQHLVEYQLGMFDSADAFAEHQNDPLRLAFGGIKAAGVAICAMMAATRLTQSLGPVPAEPYWKHLLRKAWDPRQGLVGPLVTALLCVPLIGIHFELNKLAMMTSTKGLLLTIDSFLVGVIALVVCTGLWASDAGRGMP